jgi:hypothetical protein
VVKSVFVLMRLVFLSSILAFEFTVVTARSDEPGCSQAAVDSGYSPPATAYYIYPRQAVLPFYQWENNNGYCGEVCIMEAGLNNGQWMSQYYTRLLGASGLSQSGPNGWGKIKKHFFPTADTSADQNAQVWIEAPATAVSGPNPYDYAALCLANARLKATTFDYQREPAGMAGYQQFMSWVKQEVINGNQVTIALLCQDDWDPQEDHIVTVIKIGTNHVNRDGTFSATYYPDDVLYFEDHGATGIGEDTSIPPGAGSDKGCLPYVFGYAFKDLPHTREQANGDKRSKPPAYDYSIVIPDNKWITTVAGGDGYQKNVHIIGPHNFAFSVSGPVDSSSETLPVALTILGPTKTDGKDNPFDPLAGYNYENPMIGKSVQGNGCTNRQPGPMTNFRLQVTVSGLTPGVAYNLFEYDLEPVPDPQTSAYWNISATPSGGGIALQIPTGNFNAHADMAAHVTKLTATGPTYVQKVSTKNSQEIVAFRCVPVDAP